MAYIASEHFWLPKNFQSAQKCRCKVHSDEFGFDVWVSTSWNKEDEGQGSERYEVKATATNPYYCRDHLGATDDRIITKVQWDNAASEVFWDFFPTI